MVEVRTCWQWLLSGNIERWVIPRSWTIPSRASEGAPTSFRMIVDSTPRNFWYDIWIWWKDFDNSHGKIMDYSQNLTRNSTSLFDNWDAIIQNFLSIFFVLYNFFCIIQNKISLIDMCNIARILMICVSFKRALEALSNGTKIIRIREILYKSTIQNISVL